MGKTHIELYGFIKSMLCKYALLCKQLCAITPADYNMHLIPMGTAYTTIQILMAHYATIKGILVHMYVDVCRCVHEFTLTYIQ